VEILLPPPRLIQLFDESVSSMFSQLENLTLQNQKFRAARVLLVPRLMSGEIEV